MSSRAALLWDESFVWGVFMYDALRRGGLEFDLVTSEEIREGALEGYAALLVPGGWASNKIKSLGAEGAGRIRDFVACGGAYFGVCGGGGMATSDGIGLIDVKRKPTGERVPSLSGGVLLSLAPHPIFEGIAEPFFHIWWPSQFAPVAGPSSVLARFDRALPDAFSSDYCVGDMTEAGWPDAERAYGINLDPARMSGDPMVVEGEFGSGKVIVSLVHFDTSDCENGARVLDNLWRYLGLGVGIHPREASSPSEGCELEAASSLYSFGLRNFLWFERGPLLQWRRGIRGFEYYTLYRMAREIARRARAEDSEAITGIEEMLGGFSRRAQGLLLHERAALQRGERITYSASEDRAIAALRLELFHESKSYGGRFKEILNRMDALLLIQLRRELSSPQAGGHGARGLVHVYTGDGKGKTTASVGLALRARSRGLRVLYAQFMKGRTGGEASALIKYGVEVLRFHEVRSPLFHPDADIEEIRQSALRAIGRVRGMIRGFDVVVLDEFVTLLSRGLVPEDAAMQFIAQKPDHLELVLTGRGATERLIAAADIVTDMRQVKHAFNSGTPARPGIEY